MRTLFSSRCSTFKFAPFVSLLSSSRHPIRQQLHRQAWLNRLRCTGQRDVPILTKQQQRQPGLRRGRGHLKSPALVATYNGLVFSSFYNFYRFQFNCKSSDHYHPGQGCLSWVCSGSHTVACDAEVAGSISWSGI